MKLIEEHRVEIQSAKIKRTWRGLVVNVICFFWQVMPRRVKLWAVMNDDS